MERTSGRTRKVSQKMSESREIFIVSEQAASKRKTTKNSHKESILSTDAKSLKSGGEPVSKNATIYHIPEPASEPVNKFIPSSVALSLLDKAEQITVSEDQMTCTGVEGGFRMIRATHGVHFGPYYWECEILPPNGGDEPGLAPHVRIGWSTRFGELRGPVGYDKHSYGYRDVAGSKVHQRMRDDDYGDSFGVGDVIGCLIDLGHSEACSEIRFFKNGVDQGRAYGPEVGAPVTKGVYFPAISLFGKAQVRVNFGPSFIEPIDCTQFKFNSYCDVQPMNAREIAEHDKEISEIRERRKRESSHPEKQSPSPTQPLAPSSSIDQQADATHETTVKCDGQVSDDTRE